MGNFGIELNRRFKQEEKKEYLGINKPINNIQPLVSVSIATYQHKDYIKNCLDGILMQQVNFLYEIIIGDDESNDGTTEICKDYAERHPDKIRLFIRDRSISHFYENGKFISRFNGIWCRMSCRGKYIALCEGDDYWTDPFKLQKQVNFLEKNEDFGACFTNAKVVNLLDSTEYEYNSVYNLKEGSVNNDLIYKYGGSIFPTLSLIFRSDLLNKLTFIEGLAGDENLIFCLSNFSKVHFMNKNTGVYRRWEGGVFSRIMNNKKKLVDYRIKEIHGYNKLSKTLKEENKKRLNIKKRKAIEFIIENNLLNSIQFLPQYGLRSFFKKIFFKC